MIRPTLRSTLAAVAIALAAIVMAQPLSAAPAPSGPAALRQAEALAAHWGRCPTSRPAHAALARARSAPARARTTRARAALRAWRTVVVECSAPVAMPVADPAG